MDFEFHYTKEQEEFRKEVRAFIEENAFKEPLAAADFNIPSPELFEKGREQQRKLGAKGWFAPAYPREYGGGGLDVERCVILVEELAKVNEERRWLLVTEIGALYAGGIMPYGTEEQKRRFLTPVLRGEAEIWQSFNEPEAGTDKAATQCRAIRDGDVYIINGMKNFTGRGPWPPHPDYLQWPAVTDPQANPREHQNLSLFWLPGNLPGITYNPQELFAAEAQKWEVFCEDVRCPAEYRIGEENNGWVVMQTLLFFQRGGHGALAPGSRFVLRFIDYCKKTMRNGQPISKDPRVQDILVQLYIEYHVGRLWGLRNFAMGQGQVPRLLYTGTQGELHGKLFAPQLGKAVLDILGPHSLIDDPELQVLAGEVPHYVRWGDFTHAGAPPEAQKILMSRGLGLGRGAARAAAAKR